EDEHQPPFDAPVTGDKAVAVILLLLHAEVGAAVGHQLVGFLEGVFVEQELNAFPRRHLPFLMLLFPARLAPALFRQAVALLKFRQLLFQLHSGDYIERGSLAGGRRAVGSSRPRFRCAWLSAVASRAVDA